MAKSLIYSFKSSGTMLPVYGSCKVYDDGLIIVEKGYLLDHSEDKKATKKLPPRELLRIKRVISDNHQILFIKELEDDGICILDGSHETLTFSDGVRKKSLKIDNLYSRLQEKEYPGRPDTPNLNLLMRTYVQIRKILIDNGVSSDCC
jgi:hypothetical protein